jgi:hypothetical protein
VWSKLFLYLHQLCLNFEWYSSAPAPGRRPAMPLVRLPVTRLRPRGERASSRTAGLMTASSLLTSLSSTMHRGVTRTVRVRLQAARVYTYTGQGWGQGASQKIAALSLQQPSFACRPHVQRAVGAPPRSRVGRPGVLPAIPCAL